MKQPTNLTLDPKIKKAAQKAAAQLGLPLSRWVEMLIRKELKK